ncbi:MAG TPA: galactose oxidase-like domain-containing protein [Terriglobales bacterium]|nr:galactose oxidase-like domain-containing protein [Terriglobales bacterium]
MKNCVVYLAGTVLICSLVGCGGGSLSSAPKTDPPTPPAPVYNPQAAKYGQWTTSSTTMPINPIHAALLHTGKILVVSGSGNCPPQQAGCPQGPQYTQGSALFDLSNNTIHTMPANWDMFCNGMSIMQDGRALLNGGTKAYGALAVVGAQGDVPFLGLPNASIFDPSSESFVDVPATAHGRWYPTLTELNDGRMMTTAGLNDTDGTNNNTSEIWNGQQWSAEIPGNPNITDFPGFQFPLYPRMHLLPTGHIFYSAPSSATVDFDPNTQTWTLVAWTIYPGLSDPNGERTYGTSVLLPLTPQNNYSPKVMIMGGDNPATKTTELIDLSPAGMQVSAACPNYAPCWVQGPPMSQARVEMEATVLPNAKVLVDAGSAEDENAQTASLQAEIYDPVSNSFSSAGSNAFPRLYHNTQLLLPDGTVFLAGGNPAQGVFEKHIEIYQPTYLFNSDGSPATRPKAATNPPSSITYGQSFTLSTPDAATITSIALMKAGSVTHSFDMDQRYVGLGFTTGQGTLKVTGPPNSNIAPPGYYMLFLVNKAGTPSLASWVQVSGTAAAVAKVELHPERVPTPTYVFQRKHVTESPLPLRKEMHIH